MARTARVRETGAVVLPTGAPSYLWWALILVTQKVALDTNQFQFDGSSNQSSYYTRYCRSLINLDFNLKFQWFLFLVR